MMLNLFVLILADRITVHYTFIKEQPKIFVRKHSNFRGVKVLS